MCTAAGPQLSTMEECILRTQGISDAKYSKAAWSHFHHSWPRNDGELWKILVHTGLSLPCTVSADCSLMSSAVAANTSRRKTGHSHDWLWHKCNMCNGGTKWHSCTSQSADESGWCLTAKVNSWQCRKRYCYALYKTSGLLKQGKQ